MQQFKGLFEILPFAQEGIIDLVNPMPFDKHLAIQGLNYARAIMQRKRPDILVLDEVNPAMYYGLLEVQDILDFLDNKHQETEVILTGSNAPAEILNYADLVTVMHPVKHYFNNNYFEPRRGIEL
jgi:cob(I)alamin adenosyltransferase